MLISYCLEKPEPKNTSPVENKEKQLVYDESNGAEKNRFTRGKPVYGSNAL